jgi:hypothetical protein
VDICFSRRTADFFRLFQIEAIPSIWPSKSGQAFGLYDVLWLGSVVDEMTRIAFLAAALAAFLGAPARGQEAPDPGLKAGALRDACDPPAGSDEAARDAGTRICEAYLRGVADGLFLLGALQQSGPVCLPNDGPISPAEAKSEFEDYLADHPEAADHSAGTAATFAIIAAHPCE